MPAQGTFSWNELPTGDIRNVPITVQVPISVAANVCQVTVAVLSNALNRGSASCSAQSNSRALQDIVQRVMNVQE